MRIIKRLHSVCRERKAEKMNVICFGDSNTYGYDGVHFTEQGHRTFAAGLLEELK